MTIDVRLAAEGEHRAIADTVASALLFPPRDDAGWERSRASWQESISYAAWDGERCVGNASQFLVDTTVPGGARLATGAVSRVGVLTTHRRRGVATRLLQRLIQDAADRDLTLMSLRASEAVIYERYGFGLAGEYVMVEIDPARASPVRGGAGDGSFRIIGADSVLDTVTPIYAAAAHRRVGTVTRPDSWWRRYFADALAGDKAAYVVVHSDADGVDDGYCSYAVSWREHDEGSGGKGEIHEIVATSDSAELALWGFMLDVDLVRVWTCEERPVDDIVRWSLGDRRAYDVKHVDDEQWMRLIDVDRALSSRSYRAAPGGVVIEVTDPLLERNCGRWEISAGGVRRSDGPADLSGDISALSAAYLGGTSWHALAATGRVRAHRHGAVADADALFGVTPLPFCGSFF